MNGLKSLLKRAKSSKEEIMKKTLLCILALVSFTSFAGTLNNKDSGEFLQFKLRNNILDIKSDSTCINDKTMELRMVKSDMKSNINLFAGFELVADGSPMMITVPFFVAYDILAMPAKALLKASQNAKYKKDYDNLINAIVSNENVEVSSSRFKRICGLIQKNCYKWDDGYACPKEYQN